MTKDRKAHKGIAQRQAASYARKAGAKFMAEMGQFFGPSRKARQVRAQLHKDNRRLANEIRPSQMANGTISEQRNS